MTSPTLAPTPSASTSMTAPGPVAVLGTGRMGAAIARSLLAGGHPVTVWNRTHARAAPLVADGARAAESVADAVASADLTIAMLTDYASTAALVQRPDVERALIGRTLVLATSGSPRAAREWGRWAESRGVRFVTAAVMAPPPFVGHADCTVFAAGDAATFAEHEGALRRVGGNLKYVGPDVGQAAAFDSALLAYFWGHLFGVILGSAVAEAEGVPLDRLADEYAALAPVVDEAGTDLLARIRTKRHGDTDATINVHHGGIGLLIETFRDHGLDTSIPDALARTLKRAIDAGDGGADLAAAANALRPVAAAR